LNARLAVRRRRHRQLHKRRRILQRQIAKLAINEPLVRGAARLEALAEQQPWLEALERRLSELEGEIASLNAERGTGKDAINPAAGRAEPLTKRGLTELQRAAKRFASARRALKEFRAARSTTPATAARLEEQIEAALGPAKSKGLTQALAEAGELVTQLRRRVQLDERLDQMSRRKSELEEQGHQALEKQMLSPWVLAGLGSLFVVGCALILLWMAGLVLPSSIASSLNWPFALFGFLFAGSAGGAKVLLERGALGRVDDCQEQSRVLTDQIAQSRTERDALDQKLPKGGGAKHPR
jgi:hypothetical protein